MGQIAVGEARTMITNLYFNSISGALTDQLHIARAVRQRVVQ